MGGEGGMRVVNGDVNVNSNHYRIPWERSLLLRFLLLKHCLSISYFQAWIAIEEQLKSLKRRKTASGGVQSSDSEEDL